MKYGKKSSAPPVTTLETSPFYSGYTKTRRPATLESRHEFALVTAPGGAKALVRPGCEHWVSNPASGTCRYKCKGQPDG